MPAFRTEMSFPKTLIEKLVMEPENKTETTNGNQKTIDRPKGLTNTCKV